MKIIILILTILNFYVLVNIFHILNKPEPSCDAEVAAALAGIEPGAENVDSQE